MVRDAPSSLRSATGRSPVRHRQSPRYLRSMYRVPYRRLDAHDLLGIYAVFMRSLYPYWLWCETLPPRSARRLDAVPSASSAVNLRNLRSKYHVSYRLLDAHYLLGIDAMFMRSLCGVYAVRSHSSVYAVRSHSSLVSLYAVSLPPLQVWCAVSTTRHSRLVYLGLQFCYTHVLLGIYLGLQFPIVFFYACCIFCGDCHIDDETLGLSLVLSAVVFLFWTKVGVRVYFERGLANVYCFFFEEREVVPRPSVEP